MKSIGYVKKVEILFLVILSVLAGSSAVNSLYASTLILDNFDNNNQYNSSHLNDFGGYTDDDGTLINDSVQSNYIRLSWNGTSNSYWYSVLSSGAGLDISSYNYLKLILRKHNSDENFFIQIDDMDNNKSQIAVGYFQPVSTDTNNFSTYLIPMTFFPYIDLTRTKSFVILFSVPFASLSSTATVDIDEISFVSTNYQYNADTISPFLVIDFEDALWHTKQGGYFATESDTNSFSLPAYSNRSISASENNTPYGKYAFRWIYSLYNGDYAYSACYFSLAPDGYYSDISDYRYLSFYVKGKNYNPYYKFSIKDKNGNSSERLFAAYTSWNEIKFDIQEMANQGNIDLKNISSCIMTIKEPGISDELYIDDVNLIASTAGETSSVSGKSFISYLSLGDRKIISVEDFVEYEFMLKDDAYVTISIYNREGIEVAKVYSNEVKKDIKVNGKIYAGNLKNGVYVIRLESEHAGSKDVVNKLIIVGR